jgi:type VI secretion system secreted protein Hcp
MKEVLMTTNHVPTRRTVLASALGVSALGGVAASSGTATAALGDPAIPSDPGVAFYLSLTDIPGSATAKGFEGQIELLTWAWGVDSTGTIGGGGGGGAGKAVPRDLIALAESGIQSPLLLTDTNTGKHVQSALVSCVRESRKPFTFMTLKFEDVLITSYAVTPDPTNGLPLDLVHIQFSKITHQVVPQNEDGSAGTPITSSFDYRTGKAD